MDEPAEQMRRKLTGVAAIVFVVCVIVVAYYVSRPEQAPTTEERVVASATSTRVSSPDKETGIVFTKKGFVPKKLTVKQGARVTVKNSSSANMQFSSSARSAKRLSNNELNLRTLLPGESASMVTSKVGTWSFRDSLGGEFTGTLKVIE